MDGIVFSVGNGLCKGVSILINSPACYTQAQEIWVGYGVLVVAAGFIGWTLKKRLNNA